jgi:hypothetical protein
VDRALPWVRKQLQARSRFIALERMQVEGAAMPSPSTRRLPLHKSETVSAIVNV